VTSDRDQGSKKEEGKTLRPFAYEPKEIDGPYHNACARGPHRRVPYLYKLGFRGKVYSTAPTKDFAEELLIDSQGLIEKDAREDGREPLYTLKDVADSLDIWNSVKYHEPVRVKEFSAEFFDAGHILGSSFIKITENPPAGEKAREKKKRRCLFRRHRTSRRRTLKDTSIWRIRICRDEPLRIQASRAHERPKDVWRTLIMEAVTEGGTLMIPDVRHGKDA
jgi:predicted metal-dependent RNase